MRVKIIYSIKLNKKGKIYEKFKKINKLIKHLFLFKNKQNTRVKNLIKT